MLIQEVKTKKYHIPEVEAEIKNALKKLITFSYSLRNKNQLLFGKEVKRFETDSKYLKEWFSERHYKKSYFTET